jgi:N-acetylglucosaminyldiphosphoundecaprenol N-acetyl-beta-D-mannosaminyltransferase
MLELCTRAAEKGHRIYLYGGKEGTPELLADKLRERFPGINIVGGYSPPFRAVTDEEDAEIVANINATQPDIVFVGLSTPKQERWMFAHTERIPAVLLGVGAAFDFHAGNLAQAPSWMQERGLEWLFRLIKEPRRLARRYLVGNPKFIAAILRRRPRLVPTTSLPGAPQLSTLFPTAQEASPS